MMPYCSKCGVETEKGKESCPLCSAPIQNLDEDTTSSESGYPEYSPSVKLTNRQIRFIVWIVLTFLFTAAFLLSLSIDLFRNGRITWSDYAMTGVGGAWACCSVVLLFMRRPWLIISTLSFVVPGLLVLLDVFDGKMDWFLTLGLPISLMTAGLSLAVYFISRAFSFRISILSALVLLASGLYCIGLDLLASAYIDSVSMSWSFIVLAATVPPAGLLIFYHWYIRKRFDIKKVFHL